MRHVMKKLALLKQSEPGFKCGQNGDPILYPRAAEARLKKSGALAVRVLVVIEAVDGNDNPFPKCSMRSCSEQATAYYGMVGYCDAHDPHAKETDENLTHEAKRGRRK